MPLSVKQQTLYYIIVIPLLFTIALSSCGKIGDPIPPDIVFPQAITNRAAIKEKKSNCLNFCGEISNMAEPGFQVKD